MKTDFALILCLWGAGLGAAGQYAKVSVVFDQIGALYPDAGASLGFIVSLVGLVGIVFGVVAGVAVARIGYRRAILTALWMGAAVSLAEATLPPLPVLLALRGVEGVSHLALVVAAPTIIAQVAAPQHRGFALTLWGSFFGVMFTLLVVLGLPLVAWGGVPALFVAHGVWMAVFAVVLAPMLRRIDLPPPVGVPGVLAAHVAIYRSPFLAAPAAGWLFYTFCFLALLTILPAHIPQDLRAVVLGVMPLTSIVASLTVGVWLLQRMTAVQVVQLGFVLSIGALVWLLIHPGAPAACLALAAALGLIQGASFAAVPQLNDTPERQAQANGGLAQMGNLGNTLGTPALLAMQGMAGYSGLILTAAVIFLGGIGIHAWMAVRRAAATCAVEP